MRSVAYVAGVSVLLSVTTGCLGYLEEGEVPSKFLPKTETKKPDAKKGHAKKHKKPKAEGAAADEAGTDSDTDISEVTEEEVVEAVEEVAPEADVAERGEGKKARLAPKTVVLLVLESVRADHMSLCGYERPTTPYLDKFIAQRDGAWGCKAYAPATTSVSADASILSGLLPDQHRVFTDRQGVDASVPLLAEHFDSEGYQTALVSGNPALGKSSGLWRGFDHTTIAPDEGWRGEQLSNKVSATLGKLNADKPLFLVVDVQDAAAPYPAVNKGAGWAPAQDGFDPGAGDLAARLLAGTMSAEERGQILRHMIDSYDAGVLEADRSVGRVAGLLRDGGWLDQGARIVVTSSHGEHLGEHDMVGSDGPPWEGVVRVPVVFRDNSMEVQPVLPDAMSTAGLYWLIKEGRVPESYTPAVAVGRTAKGAPDAVAVWDVTGGKVMRLGDRTVRFDLGRDPGETRPLDVARSPLATRLSEAAGKLERR